MKMPAVKDLPLISDLPNPFVFQDGSKISNLAEWKKRKEEIAGLYQYYMYGVLPDTSGESISKEYIDSCKLASWSGEEIRTTTSTQKILRLKIAKGDRRSSFSIVISFPTEEREDGEFDISPPVHEGGYPVLIVIGLLGKAQKKYLNDHGYVVIEFSNNEVAAEIEVVPVLFMIYTHMGRDGNSRQVQFWPGPGELARL